MAAYPDERRAKSQATAARWAQSAQKHRQAEDRARAKGNDKAAALARRQAERAERFARARQHESDSLAAAAARSAAARRLNEESAQRMLGQAVRRAEETPRPVARSAKEERAEARAAAKRELMARQAETARQRDLKAADAYHDPRTAAGQREIEVRGPTVAKRASLAPYAALIHRQSDRTPPRLIAMSRFDELWHRAHAGMVPGPRFERGVDTSRKVASVPEDRADSIRAVDAIRANIGEDAFALLYHRLIGGQSFAWMASQDMGEPERLGVLFLAAVDALARHFGLARSRAVEAMESEMEIRGLDAHSQGFGRSHSLGAPAPGKS